MPWKSNPVMIFYNKDLFEEGRLDPENPPLATYDEFLATSKKIVDSGAAQAAIWPAPTSEFFQSWFDFYPLFAAETGGKQLVEDGKAAVRLRGRAAASPSSGRTLYDEGLARKEAYNGDSFADGKAAMAIVGPWAIAVYGDKVDWGARPGPDLARARRRRRPTRSATPRTSACTRACENQGHRVGRAEVRDQRGAGRQAAGDDRPDAAARRT